MDPWISPAELLQIHSELLMPDHRHANLSVDRSLEFLKDLASTDSCLAPIRDFETHAALWLGHWRGAVKKVMGGQGKGRDYRRLTARHFPQRICLARGGRFSRFDHSIRRRKIVVAALFRRRDFNMFGEIKMLYFRQATLGLGAPFNVLGWGAKVVNAPILRCSTFNKH